MSQGDTQDLAGRRIGWIGVGRMGTPICRRLLGAGARLQVFDIEPARSAALAADGADVAGGITELCAAAEVIFAMVPDDAALLAVALGEGGLGGAIAGGQVFVDMSTVSPGASTRVADGLAASGCAYLRCPVSGSTATAAAGTLTVFCSGPRGAYDQCRDVLQAFSSRQSYFGAGEEARAVKLMINMIVAATPVVLGEALAFGKALGLDWEAMVDAFGESVVASPLLAYKAEAMKRRDWTPMAPVDLTAKDVDLALAVAREHNLPLPIAALLRQFAAAFQAAGDGGLDFFSLVTWPERLGGRA